MALEMDPRLEGLHGDVARTLEKFLKVVGNRRKLVMIPSCITESAQFSRVSKAVAIVVLDGRMKYMMLYYCKHTSGSCSAKTC